MARAPEAPRGTCTTTGAQNHLRVASLEVVERLSLLHAGGRARSSTTEDTRGLAQSTRHVTAFTKACVGGRAEGGMGDNPRTSRVRLTSCCLASSNRFF